ncbi:HAMP domain-containing sensor histidine kinase [Flavobacterium sp.]|uniref:sensor histidine kinase n=1 Tax=Flavobacterium sp. TaxID=239 RepID=UPI00286E52C3|nr:HAMP domain-containing sensor histidine kinase [Flavobacterium sp.]
MNFYRKLSKVSFLENSYAYKFLFVTFIGIHIPLIGLLLFVLFGDQSGSVHSILFFTLVLTLIATGITLFVLKKLIKPIEIASKALNNYRNNRVIPQLPIYFKDEAGLLLTNIQKSIIDNEKYITDKQDLMYLLSHDLRSFAGNAQSLAQLILEENASDSVKEYANLICQSTGQQFEFIETLINLMKDEDEISKKVHNIKNIQLPTIFNLVGEQLGQKLATKKIQLKTDIEIAEARIIIDEELLIRVLVNLIDNAIKFSFPNSEIKARVYTENGKIIFVISDSGLGFKPEYKEELFEKFTNRGKLGTAN